MFLSSVTCMSYGKACNFFADVTVVLPIRHILAVQNELVAAYNELRDELAQEKLAEELCSSWMKIQQNAIREYLSAEDF